MKVIIWTFGTLVMNIWALHLLSFLSRTFRSQTELVSHGGGPESHNCPLRDLVSGLPSWLDQHRLESAPEEGVLAPGDELHRDKPDTRPQVLLHGPSCLFTRPLGPLVCPSRDHLLSSTRFEAQRYSLQLFLKPRIYSSLRQSFTELSEFCINSNPTELRRFKSSS